MDRGQSPSVPRPARRGDVKLVAAIKLQPTPEQRTLLLAAMEQCNAACDWLAEQAFEAQESGKYELQKRHYSALRDRFGLPAQMAVRTIAKVCEVYRRDRSIQPEFRPRGAVQYDQRLYTVFEGGTVSLATLDGRITLPWVAGDHQRALLRGTWGQADLVLKKGRWYLYVSVEVPEATVPEEPTDWLGVDLGIVNLATDSDGERHSGAPVEAVRLRHQTLRAALQKRDTRSARKHLKRLSGQEARFRSDTNHVLSKHLVAKAQGTARGIALEDLQGIRARVTARRSQRARLGSWAFYQLRFFVSYKALRVGVLVRLVDPRNTSRTCIVCGYCAKANRQTQADFKCKSCGYTANADCVAAVNIARRAAVNRPIVSGDEAGRPGHHRSTSWSPGASPGL